MATAESGRTSTDAVLKMLLCFVAGEFRKFAVDLLSDVIGRVGVVPHGGSSLCVCRHVR